MLADILDDTLITSLNNNELKILQYIYAHSQEIQHSTIRQLAGKLNCSTTTILRFCQKINLSGYSELKYQLKKQGNETASDTNEVHWIQDIENTLLLLRQEDVDQVITLLESNRNIHLFGGAGITARVIDYLEKLCFSYGRQNVYRYDASALAFHVAEQMTEQDILFLISSSGKYVPTIKLANLAKTRQATVIAISPFSDNLLAAAADINFRFFSHERKNKNTEYTSRLPIYYMIETIFSIYHQFKEEQRS